ncbi:NAD-dependent epimerase [Cohnella algarum]|uniref:NAD-dependent epimerase n=1 Tax=Cohnella algarum TaxID=2044859 RepID=UPI001967BDE4|nr:NAD-dependent epimerase [Cohnella algarum]MBN2980655.1 NAD-dependent epimerase [Cohnella algarum]
MELKSVDNSKVYLVTGAAGFIGMHLSKRLLELGCKVIGLDNINEYYDVELKYARLNILNKFDQFTFHKADIVDKVYLQRLFSDTKIHVVINLAAQAGVRYSIENPDAYIQSNVVGFLNILEMCRHFKVAHLLYASSSSVYGGNEKVPFSTEDRTDNPVSLYAATKKSNELMAHTYSHLYKIPTTGLRFFTVYGPYGRPDMAYFSFTKAIIEGKPIMVYNNGDMYRDFTYIEDIVEGVIKLSNKSQSLETLNHPYKLYNLGNNRPEKLMTLIEELEKQIGKKALLEFHPMQPGDVYKTYADIKSIKNSIDFCPKTTLNTGLRHFVSWYKGYIMEGQNE